MQPSLKENFINMRQQKLLDLDESWEEIAFDLTEYSSSHFQSILQSFNQDFIQELPFLDENFISNILNDISK